MRIAFGDFCRWDFHVGTVDTSPLGGSHSAACYLARALVRLGHDVTFLSHTSQPGVHHGVTCRSWNETEVASLRSQNYDVFVSILAAGNGRVVRAALGPATRLILWTQHRADQPGVEPLKLPAERDSYDRVVFVSDWQRREFIGRFAVDMARTAVLGNAVAPAFESLFAADSPIVTEKAMPPVMAYTSTPFRGLDLLLDAFPLIRESAPDARLRVYSSMQVYRMPGEDDQRSYGALYQRCREMAGVEYRGSIAQSELAREMRETSVFAYPNTFAETYCISAIEALAAGCRVVTSDFGALRETTAGMADLVPVTGRSRRDYMVDFADRTVRALRQSGDPPPSATSELRRQIELIQRTATWERRAQEWDRWLRSISAG